MSHAETLPPGHFHHFEPEQAYHASKLGMWLFLATEVLLFGGLFCAYAVFRHLDPGMYAEYSKYLDWKLGATNTLVLLISSYAVAVSVTYAQKGQNKKVFWWILVAVLCGAGFMCIKYIEYSHKIHAGYFPPQNIYFGLYFAMTGLHGVHVVVGMGVLIWVMLLARKNRFSETYYTPVEVSGLYWHLVDLIWIYLFPLLYLI